MLDYYLSWLVDYLGVAPFAVEILGDHAFGDELLEKREAEGLIGGAGGRAVPSERLIEREG